MRALLKQLYRWRFRERLVRLVWGGGRLLAIAAVALLFCCWIDYEVDKSYDVPGWLRFGMLAFQASIAAVMAYFFLVRPWNDTPPVDDLASRAEKAIPEFDHRLVTAIQLNRETARTAGMSPALIAEVTREAAEMAARHRLTRLIDYSRLGWAVLVILPIALLWGMFFVFKPAVATALLQRQALLDVEIPRSIALANTTTPLWPSGDEVTIRFEVNGRFRESSVGTVYVYPQGDQPRETYELKFNSILAPGKALFTATIPHSSADFTFRARLADARTREMGNVRFAPRPTVLAVEAFALLPEYLGLIPSGEDAGKRYRQAQHQGEVLALPESAIGVTATFDKPVTRAELVLLEIDPRTKLEKPPTRRLMTLAEDRQSATDLFDLKPGYHGYRIEVEDENGFKNLAPMQRGLATIKDEPPEVMLLQEAYKHPNPEDPEGNGKGPIEEYEVNGIPIPVGGPIVIGYHARSPMGIDKVWIYYRVNDESDTKRQFVTMTILGAPIRFWTEVEIPKWYTQLLNPDVVNLAELGPFVPEIGLFQNSRDGRFGQVELYKFPSPSPETEPGELEAGGRYNFRTGGLRKTGPDGQPTKLEPGDRVELYVAASDKAPGANRPLGRSESRIKAIVTKREADEWVLEHARSKERLKDILDRQREIPFGTTP